MEEKKMKKGSFFDYLFNGKPKEPGSREGLYVPLVAAAVVSGVIISYLGIGAAVYANRFPRSNIADVILNARTFMNPGFIVSTIGYGIDWKYIWLSLCGYAALLFAVYVDIERNKLRLPNREKGDAKWNDYKNYNLNYVYPKGKKKDVNEAGDGKYVCEPGEDSEEIGNMIISQHVRLNMNIRQTRLNDNVLIDGTTGSGKTYGFVKPNIMQFNTSYIVTDPSGELLRETGQALLNHGYTVKVLNLAEMMHSGRYNPFRYIRNDEGVLTLVKCMMSNTDDSKSSKGDQFFTKAEEGLFLALFYYIYYEYADQPEKQNMDTVMQMLAMAKASEKNEDIKSQLDLKFDALERKSPNHVAVKNYKTFKQGTGKTLKSILISAGVRMTPFNIPAVRNLMMDDDLHLEELGDKRQALFIITKAEDPTYNFIAAMAYTQMFETLYYRAGTENPRSWLLQKGPNVSLRSKMFKNSKQKDEQKKWLEQERERYMKAEIRTEDENDPKFQNEDEQGLIPWPKTEIYLPETGEVLRTFNGRKEAEIFMDCIKNGKIVQGTKRLPSHVRCILDEFANIGEIPNFDSKLSTFRKYEISAVIILQSLSQLKDMYKDKYATIIGNCSTQLFLGTEDKEDTEYYSEMLGNTTVDVLNTSISYKEGQSSSKSLNKDSVPLMRPEQIRTMDPNQCLVLIYGQDPFKDEKFNPETHPNYGELMDADPANEFEFRRIFYIKQIEDQIRSANEISVEPDIKRREEMHRQSVENHTARRRGFRSFDQFLCENFEKAGNSEAADSILEEQAAAAGALKDILDSRMAETYEKALDTGAFKMGKQGEVLMDDDIFSSILNGGGQPH